MEAARPPGEVIIADLDGDGWSDLVLTHRESSAVGVMYGQGYGSFGSEALCFTDPLLNGFGSDGGPFTVKIADFDGNGLVDLAVANGGEATVAVLFARSDGTFSNDTRFVTATDGWNGWLYDLVVGDVNADGRPDVVTAGDRLTVLSNTCR